MNWIRLVTLCIPFALLAALGCGKVESTPARTRVDAGTPPDGGQAGPMADGGGSGCRTTTATTVAMCMGSDCPFDPTTIDCTVACTNAVATCEDADCEADCAGIAGMDACVMQCEFTASTISCPNIYFGCTNENDTCEAVNSCLTAMGF